MGAWNWCLFLNVETLSRMNSGRISAKCLENTNLMMNKCKKNRFIYSEKPEEHKQEKKMGGSIEFCKKAGTNNIPNEYSDSDDCSGNIL